MLNKFLFIAATILTLGINASIAQEGGCGTLMNSRQRQILNDFSPQLDKSAFRIAATTYEVAVSVHIVRRDDGTGGLTDEELLLALDDVNFFFADAGLHFFVIHKEYIDATEYFDFVNNQETELALKNDIENTINIYFVNSMETTEGLALCGYAYLPGGPERVVLDKNCAINGSTFPHEMGHFFSLLHTHGLTSTGTDELVDGSNCTSAGDEICDTPADPVLSLSNVSSLCVYNGTDVDANDDLYVPNVHNLMSYAPKTCRDEFSDQQYSRMSDSYLTHRSNLYSKNVIALYAADEPTICEGNSIVFQNKSINGLSYDWMFEGGTPSTSSVESPEVIYDALGTYDVRLIVTGDGSVRDTLFLEDYISVEVPSRPLFTDRTEDFEGEISTEVSNPDGDTTFVYIDSVSFEGSHSAFINFYEYADIGEEDFLILPSINTEINKEITVDFEYAYTYYDDGLETYLDELQVVYRNECEKEWNVVWQKSGADLATSAAMSTSFIPVPSDWDHVTQSFTVSDTIESIEVAFKAINGWGNNLYLDNLEVTTKTDVDFGTISITTDPTSCYGDIDGAIQVSTVGPGSSYEYSLDDLVFSSGGIFNGLAGGQYLLYVLMDSQDTLMKSVTVYDPDSVVANYQLDVPSCSTGGSVDVTLSGLGGSGIYQFKLDDGVYDSEDTFIGLINGEYKGYVMDENGCEDSVVFEVVTYDSLIISATKSDILCYGAKEGLITLDITGGLGKVYCTVNGVNYDTISEFYGLAPGIYEVVVKDQTLCEWSQTFTISQPSEVQTFSGSISSSCAHEPDGEINVVASGGNGQFTYSIDSGKTWTISGAFEGLSKGEYMVLVSDREGCEYSEEVEVGGPDPIDIEFIVEDEECYNSGTGSISISVEGGEPPYTLLMDGESVGSNIGSLTSGKYAIQISDGVGCAFLDTVEIQSLYDSIAMPEISLSSNILSVEPQSGFRVVWYRNGIEVLTDEAGTYEVLQGGNYTAAYVNEETGCLSLSDLYVIQSFKRMVKEITIGPNPVEDYLHIVSPEVIKGALISVSAYDITGDQIFTIPYKDDVFFDQPPGVYFVVIRGDHFDVQIRILKQ